MTKRALFLSLVIILFFSGLWGNFTSSEDTKAKIIEATEVLFNPDVGPTQDNILDSLFQLLDVSASITTAAEYKDDIEYRIDVAKELFKDDSLFNEKARQYLSFAYRMMTNGQKYENPEELEVFVTPDEAQEKAMKYAKELVEKALFELDNGHPGETAKLLLELVLMTVTPISG